MKVMYVACNPSGASELMIERELTELQRIFLTAAGERVEFLVYPSLPLEELPVEITAQRPDILHISAHGESEGLYLSNADGIAIQLTGAMLCAFMDTDHTPRLVYLNACNSDAIARDLVSLVPMAVGTTAPITNRAARAAALLFYNRLLTGSTVQKAFVAGRATIEALQGSKASSQLFVSGGVDPSTETLHQIPRIVARFYKDRAHADSSGYFTVEMGLYGCPGDTAQVVLFTDDSTFLDDENGGPAADEYSLASDLCRVVRGRPVRNALWSQSWEQLYGDYRVFAIGVTGKGDVYAVKATLCEALEVYYSRRNNGDVSQKLRRAVDAALVTLRHMDGADAPSSGPRPGPPAARSKPSAKDNGTGSRSTRKKRSEKGKNRRLIKR